MATIRIAAAAAAGLVILGYCALSGNDSENSNPEENADTTVTSEASSDAAPMAPVAETTVISTAETAVEKPQPLTLVISDELTVSFADQQVREGFARATLGLTQENLLALTSQTTLEGVWRASGAPEMMDHPARHGRGALYNDFSADFYAELDRNMAAGEIVTLADLLEASQEAFEHAHEKDASDEQTMTAQIGIEPIIVIDRHQRPGSDLITADNPYGEVIIRQGDDSVLESHELRQLLDGENDFGGISISVRYQSTYNGSFVQQGLVSDLGGATNRDAIDVNTPLSELENPLFDQNGAIYIQGGFESQRDGQVIIYNSDDDPLNFILAPTR